MILSGESVALFLMMSGFGLTLSMENNKIGLKDFVLRRINRVMIPYWFSTIIILFLDFVILNRIYSLQNIFMTMIGININSTTQHIDYVRWYITFILFWYITFEIFTIAVKERKMITLMFYISPIIFLLNYYCLHLGWYQIFAFPIGCFLAYYKTELLAFTEYYKRKIWVFLPLIWVGLYFYKSTLYAQLVNRLPFVVCGAMNEAMSILFSISLILLFIYIGRMHIYSRLLLFLGSISYELFLIHGAFLIRYNPFFSNNKPVGYVVQFLIFLSLIIFLSFIFQKFIKKIII